MQNKKQALIEVLESDITHLSWQIECACVALKTGANASDVIQMLVNAVHCLESRNANANAICVTDRSSPAV